MLMADTGRWNGFGETRPAMLENVTPEVELPSVGELKVIVDGCCRTENIKVLFMTRRMHCGCMT
jgi:hypothetical protein